MSEILHTGEPQILIAGLGLLGGSIAKSLRRTRPNARITALVRDVDRYQAAVEDGLVDAVVVEPSSCDAVDLAVVCTPVDRVAAMVRSIAQSHPAAVITDVGSAKAEIIRSVQTEAQDAHFVGAHPLAGSEKTGWRSATDSLLTGAVCVVCPDGAAQPSFALVSGFWQMLDMRTLTLDAREHDRQLAATSHLPHLVAASLAVSTEESELEMMATGYRDTTRIAAGDPKLWRAIVEQNAEPIELMLEQFISETQSLQTSLQQRDFDAVERFLERAAAHRQSLQERSRS